MVFLDCIQIVPQIDIFVRSGGIYFDDGTVGGPHSGGMGDTNRTWSSRSGAATDAYDLNFNAADVHPSWGPRNRYHGLPLRWFCRGGVPIFDIYIFLITSLIQYSGSGGGNYASVRMGRVMGVRR